MAIKRQIEQGELLAGQKLPSLRSLCVELDVAYTTVARAIRILVEDGVLQANSGGGTWVASRPMKLRNALGVIGFASYQDLLTRDLYNPAMLHRLQDQIIAAGRAMVYDRWEPTVNLCDKFNRLELIDGLFVFGVKNLGGEEVRSVSRLGRPVVALGGTVPPISGIFNIDSDAGADIANALAGLKQLGHRRIAFVAKDSSFIHRERTEAYHTELTRQGLDDDPALLMIGSIPEAAATLLKMRRPPSALILDHAGRFPELMRLLKGTALEPGGGLAMCVFDDNLWDTVGSAGIEHLRIDQPIGKIAAAAVEAMCSQIEGSDWPHGPVLRLPSTLLHAKADGSIRRITPDLAA